MNRATATVCTNEMRYMGCVVALSAGAPGPLCQSRGLQLKGLQHVGEFRGRGDRSKPRQTLENRRKGGFPFSTLQCGDTHK